MGATEFDYYIFIDYSENLIGYIILEKSEMDNCLSKISKFKHYKELRYKKQYLRAMKKLFVRDKILEHVEKHKITELRRNIELCSEVFDFCKKKPNSKIFISVDDRQYKGFMKLANMIDGNGMVIVKEGKLKKGSKEYKLSLIIDTLLNLKRIK
jgi:hypothetical protein